MGNTYSGDGAAGSNCFNLSANGGTVSGATSVAGSPCISLVAGSNITLTGTAPNQITIASSGGGGGSMTFTLAGDSGTSQTISNGNTLTVAGGTGLASVASNTDTVTLNISNTGVTAAAYTNANITVNAQGQITAAADGTAATIAGTIADTQVAYGTAGDTIGGDANFTYATGTGTMLLGAANTGFLGVGTAATPTGGRVLEIQGSNAANNMVLINNTGSTSSFIQFQDTGTADSPIIGSAGNDLVLETQNAAGVIKFEVANSQFAMQLNADKSLDMQGSLTKYNNVAPAAGQLLIGDATAGIWDAATLTAGANITITDGDGTIEIAASGGGGGVSLSGSTATTIPTVTGANALQGEANLTFDGTTLGVAGKLQVQASASAGTTVTTGTGVITPGVNNANPSGGAILLATIIDTTDVNTIAATMVRLINLTTGDTGDPSIPSLLFDDATVNAIVADFPGYQLTVTTTFPQVGDPLTIQFETPQLGGAASGWKINDPGDSVTFMFIPGAPGFNIVCIADSGRNTIPS